MTNRSDELEEFMKEAETVRALTSHPGWAILRRDLDETITQANLAWPHLNPKDRRFSDLRIKILACRMLIEIVEDYEANRLHAEREWLKSKLPELYVEADVDNETPLKDKET